MASPRKSFRTAKGTELPLLNLKNKEYLQVAHRLVWFREENPQGSIKTQMIEKGGDGKDEFAVFRAEIFVRSGEQMMLVATAHKKETAGGFADYLEKAETGSVGRALALMGYGTQFTADELDEGVRLADAPVDVIAKSAPVDNSATGVSDVVTPMRRSSFRKTTAVPASASTSQDDI